jgi:hypothetical protein
MARQVYLDCDSKVSFKDCYRHAKKQFKKLKLMSLSDLERPYF